MVLILQSCNKDKVVKSGGGGEEGGISIVIANQIWGILVKYFGTGGGIVSVRD